MPLPGGLPPFRITVGLTDFTNEAENITFSNTDPGGYEMASFDLQAGRADAINPGDRVRIYEGQSIVWEGRVAEPQKTIQHGWHVHRKVGSAVTRVQCEGYGASLKDNLMSMVYVDRDMTQWGSPSITRQISLANGSDQLISPSVGPDPSSGGPSLVCQITDSWVAPYVPIVESLYDAGPGNLIGKIFYYVNNPVGLSNWYTIIGTSSTPEFAADTFVTQHPLNPTWSGYFTPSTAWRWGFFQFYTQTTPGGAQGAAYPTYWQIAVYGNHNLPGRGGDPVGFYTSDIALDAAMRAQHAGSPFSIGRVDTISQYIIPHYVQRTPVQHDQVISDMAKLGYAHYGIWEADSIFDELPTFTFRAYGSDADCFTSLSDCDEADISERLANLYTTAVITYQDGAGSGYESIVQLPNYILSKVGITRTVTFDLGISGLQAASAFAGYVLQILFAQARTAGSVQLPKKIRTSTGAAIPAYRLKAGINRIRIADAPTRAGEFTGSDRDSFRISRVESNVDTTSGQVTTRVELDSGPNLIETLQARLQIAQSLASF